MHKYLMHITGRSPCISYLVNHDLPFYNQQTRTVSQWLKLSQDRPVVSQRQISSIAPLNESRSIKLLFNIILPVTSSEWHNLFVFPNNISYVLYKPTMFVICHYANLISSYSVGSPVVLVKFVRRNFLKPITFSFIFWPDIRLNILFNARFINSVFAGY